MSIWFSPGIMVSRINFSEVAMPRLQPSHTQESRPHQRALTYSDDQCVQKLALLIENRDAKTLAEIASLISRLAVTIE
jgi:hypothetical protein